MELDRKRRSLTFRIAYWARIQELVRLMTKDDQGRASSAAQDAGIDRRAMRAIRQATESGHGNLTLEAADAIAKRYALWTTKRKFDWGTYPPSVAADTRVIDGQLTSGIWRLDVELRREVESLLTDENRDVTEAAELRNRIEAAAGELAASLALAATWHQQHEAWDGIAGYFDEVCNDLDAALSLAGAPVPLQE